MAAIVGDIRGRLRRIDHIYVTKEEPADFLVRRLGRMRANLIEQGP